MMISQRESLEQQRIVSHSPKHQNNNTCVGIWLETGRGILSVGRDLAFGSSMFVYMGKDICLYGC